MSSAPTTKSSASFTGTTQLSDSILIPDFISLDKWGDTGFEWMGEVKPSSFERLNDLLNTEQPQKQLQISANLYRHNNVLHFAFDIIGTVWLTCQRCLQPISVDLTGNYDIALLEDNSQVHAFDEEQDYLLLNEIINTQTSERILPFKTLIEDEILLETPIAPKHDDCEMSIEQVGDIPEEENENPFAALLSLKGKL